MSKTCGDKAFSFAWLNTSKFIAETIESVYRREDFKRKEKNSYKINFSANVCTGLENIEVMRAHRTKIIQAASSTSTTQPRPIHVYLLRYPATARFSYLTTCQNLFEVQEPNYEETKEREGVYFAFIPWSVPK